MFVYTQEGHDQVFSLSQSNNKFGLSESDLLISHLFLNFVVISKLCFLMSACACYNVHGTLTYWTSIVLVNYFFLIRCTSSRSIEPCDIRFVISPANEINSKIVEKLEVIRGVRDTVWSVP